MGNKIMVHEMLNFTELDYITDRIMC